MIAKFKLFGVEEDIPTTSTPGVAFNNQTLAPQKGVYTVKGVNYDCQKEGFYFWYDADTTIQRYICDYPMNTANIDPKKFLSALAYMHVHGLADDSKLINDKTYWMTHSKLRTSCGPTTDWCEFWLSDNFIGFPFRQVSVLTADTPNNYADGHIAFEIKINGSWRLFDADIGCFYKDATTGDHLDLKGIVEQFKTDNVAIEWLADPGVNYDPHPKDSAFDESGWAGHDLATESKILAWAKRSFQIPGIWNKNKTVCKFYMPAGTSSRQNWVISLSGKYVVTDETTWQNNFY